MKDDVDIVKEGLRKKNKSTAITIIPNEDLLSTGSTLLNLACSGKAIGGFAKGHQYLFVGDSDSGKTFCTLTSLAEACRNKNFDGYDLVYNGTENGAMMDIATFYGKKLEKRIEQIASPDIQHLYFDLDDRIKKGRPFIYIVDSMDALTNKDQDKKFEKQKLAYRKGREEAGSFGDGKAKINSENLRRIISKLGKTGSILILIGQSRDVVGGMPMRGDTKTRAGGRALKFYCALEMWSSQAGKIKKNVNGKDREQGLFVRIKVKKNRIVGRNRTVDIPLYHSYGIDDLHSCINFLIEEKHWRGSKSKVNAPEFDFNGPITKLIKQIEKNGEERELRAIVTKVWHEIEDQLSLKRKPKYE